jgi:hypothetical protein
MLSTEEIVDLYNQRRNALGPIHDQMRKVRELANGDIILPLNELDQNAKSSVANLLNIGLDQMSMRVASTMPTPYFPPIREGVELQKKNARLRKQAMLAMWDHNRMSMKLRRRARHLLGYSQSAVMLKPDFKTLMPTWHVRNPLDTYAAPVDDPDNPLPENCIFSYRVSASYLVKNYGDLVVGKLRMGRLQADTMFTMLEYVDHNCIHLVVQGAEDNAALTPMERAGLPAVMLEYIPNRTGMPLAVVANRITLDKPHGQFDGVLGMYYTRARLQALTEIAIERGIFPAEYLVARPGENPEIISVANPKTGEIGIVKGGDLTQQQLNPGYKTEMLLDRLERQERLEGAIPAEFGGESATNIRTGRRGESVLSATVDYRVQEAQATFEQSMLAEDKIAIAIEKAYWGSAPKSFYIPGRVNNGETSYVPDKVWQTDFHYVAYSAAGSDVNSLIIGLGQRLGTGLMSKESAREADPLIGDPDLEHDRIIAEGVESALLSSIQQQAANPQGPYQPEDLAYLTKLVVEKDVPLFEAVQRTDQRARDRQAAMAPQGAPETMPGLAMPGMGAEMQAGPPEMAGPPPIQNLLAQLGG